MVDAQCTKYFEMYNDMRMSYLKTTFFEEKNAFCMLTSYSSGPKNSDFEGKIVLF